MISNSMQMLMQQLAAGQGVPAATPPPPPPPPGLDHQQILLDTAAAASTAATHAASAATAAAQACRKPIKIPKEILVALEGVKKRFEGDLRKLAAATRRADKVTSELADFERGPGRYPAGTRPFSSSATQVELDEACTSASAGPLRLQIVVPQGSTYREAMAHVHWTCSKEMRALELEAAKDKLMSARQAATKETFSTSVRTLVLSASQRDIAAALGLEQPLYTPIPETEVSEHAAVLYKQAVDRVAKEVEAKKEEQTKKKAK